MENKIESDSKKTSLISAAKKFLTRDIWNVSAEEKSFKKLGLSILRVILKTVNGIVGKRVLVQASSLSYATLLAIGPILAITIIFSSMFFQDKGEKFIYEKIMDGAAFVMPAFNEMVSVESKAGAENALNKQIFEFINNISKGSSKAGAISVITMLVTCLLLCINMESAINYIWGVKKGRNWVNRIVFYFALMFFGSVGSIFGMTFLATSELSGYVQGIPIISDYVAWIAYFIGMGLMVSVLAIFYKFIPCVRVKWSAAFVGAFVIVFLLVLNNKLSFLYISYIVKQQNFYGYLAIVAVIMFSLYIFWMMILAGAQITYAVQYVDFLSGDDSWENMGSASKALCELAVFGSVSKAFYDGVAAPTLEMISANLKISKVTVSACLDNLIKKKYVCMAEPLENDSGESFFKPSVSPDNVKLGDFLKSVTTQPEDFAIMEMLARENKVIANALDSFEEYSKLPIPSKTVRELIS